MNLDNADQWVNDPRAVEQWIRDTYPTLTDSDVAEMVVVIIAHPEILTARIDQQKKHQAKYAMFDAHFDKGQPVTSPMPDMPEHSPITINADGHGPANLNEAVAQVCWCADPACGWTTALKLERAAGWRDGYDQAVRDLNATRARRMEDEQHVRDDADKRDEAADGRDWKASKRDMAANVRTWMTGDDNDGKAEADREASRDDRHDAKDDRVSSAVDRELLGEDDDPRDEA